MNKWISLALLHKAVEDALKNIEVPVGDRGPRGLRGADGNDFDIDNHKEAILDLIVSKIPEKVELTDEQKLELQGPRGRDGRDGQDGADGKDGKDFNFEEHQSAISKIIEEHTLTFEKLTEDQIALLRGPKGRDGKDGQDGKHFDFEEHRAEIEKLLEANALTFDKLTEEQRETLRGPRGRTGEKGENGKDFVFEEHLAEISQIIEAHSLSFDKLSDDQIALLRGPEGRRGKDGKDFSFEDSRDSINEIVISYLGKIRDSLALKFNDLTEDQVASLKGSRGQRGKPGKDFSFEESREEISSLLNNFVSEKVPDLKLKFSDLTSDDKAQLTLKFDHLTDDEKFSLRGPRGQKGKKGDEGTSGEDGKSAYELALFHGFKGSEEDYLESLKGKTGARGPVGMPGVVGRTGQAGRDGVDGKDAPVIQEVRLDKKGEEISFEFYMSNGSRIDTNYVTLPKRNVSQYITNIMGGGGGSGSGGSGGTNGKSSYELAVDNGFTGTLQDFLDSLKGADGAPGTNGVDGINGADGQDGVDGKSAYEIAVDNGFVGTEAEWLESLKGADGLNGGADGVDGKSAYEIAVDNGFVGTEAEWLESLKGADGTGSGSGTALTVIDETTIVSTQTSKISFVGEYVRVTAYSTMSQWPNLNAVGELDNYSDPSTDSVVVTIEPPDSSIIRGVPCSSDTYIGSFVRMTNGGQAVNAVATSYETSNVIGIVEKKISPTLCDIRVSGISGGLYSGLDTSKDYFLSDVTPGELVDTTPIISGHIKLRLGQAFSATQFLFAKGDRVERA